MLESVHGGTGIPPSGGEQVVRGQWRGIENFSGGEQYDSSNALVAVSLGSRDINQEDCWEAAASVCVREDSGLLPLFNIL